MKQQKMQRSCEESSRPFFYCDEVSLDYIRQQNLTKIELEVYLWLKSSRRSWHTLKTTVKSLAERLDVALSTMYRVLATLAQKGLITINRYASMTGLKVWAINWVATAEEKERANKARQKTIERKKAAEERKAKRAEASEAAKKAAAQAEAEKFVAATQSNPAVAKATEPVAYNPNRPFDPAYDPRERDEQGNIKELKLSPESEAIRARLFAEATKRDKIKNLGYDIDRLKNRPTS